MYDRKDAYYRRARREGLRSRAAFKLEDLGRDLLRPAQKVVDLGCWPGGWLQMASRQVGPGGRVVGVDLRRVDSVSGANVSVIVGDVAVPETRQALRQELGGPADVVLSDMAPKLSGIRDRDQARARELALLAIDVAAELLREGGSVVVKLFVGPDQKEIEGRARALFRRVSTRRSRATRKGSAEIYLVAEGFDPAALSRAP